MVRNPAVAGMFYSGSKAQLLREMEKMIPGGSEKAEAIGAIAPHAGYMYSGNVAGEVFSRLKPRKTYVILSPNHTGLGEPFACSTEPWKTPLGIVEVDHGLVGAIMEKTGLVTEDPMAHEREHSIEVQLPFIQMTSPEAKIVPITVMYGGLAQLREVAGAIASAIKETGADAMIVASSDMTHYEPRRSAERKDKLAIEKVVELDAEGLLEVVRRENISMCGCVPAAIMLLAAKELGASKGELVKYTDSGESTGDTDQVVGYAGIVVY